LTKFYCNDKNYFGWLVEQGLTSRSTQFRSFRKLLCRSVLFVSPVP